MLGGTRMKNRQIGILILSLIVTGSPISAKAYINRMIVQQPRNLGMGSIGVGIAGFDHDEYALFNNPAGLVGNTTDEIRLIGLSLEGSDDIYSSSKDIQAAFSDFKPSSLSVLAGQNIYFRGGLTPMYRMGHFALAYLVDGEYSMTQYNASNPDFDIAAMTTHGLQAGYGWSLAHGRRPKDDLRFGVGAKMLFRRGGFFRLGPADLVSATNNPTGYITELMGPVQTGVGFDVGTQYVYHISKSTDVSFGSSLTDVFDTRFGGKAETIPMNWSFGFGFKTSVEMFKITTGLDFRDLTATSDFMQKVHWGMSLSVPFIDFYLGLNQFYLTYGLGFDIWIARVSVVSSEMELGYRFRQNASRRYLVQFDFKLPI